MKFILTAPSKTFLLGEYVALHGGPALVLTTEPVFKLIVTHTSTLTPVICEGIDSESPAGKLLLQAADSLKGYHLQFYDPHQRMGGFGASSAQFLLIFTLIKLLTKLSLNFSINIESLLNNYQQFTWDGQGLAPSGADVVAQAQGNISYFYKQQKRLMGLPWPFKEINYYLIKTGNKLPTHQHLKQLTSLATNSLANITFAGLQHLQTNNSEGFVKAIADYAKSLHEQHLVTEKTLEILAILQACPFVLAAKGCGALGADVILVLAATSNHALFTEWLKSHHLTITTYGQQVSAGLQINSGVELII